MTPPALDLTAATFDVDVLQRSHETPVLVDFWAPWCGPCRMLTPVLEELAAELSGAFILAKANTEAEPALGQRFAIRSIPAVKLFVDGEVVGEFSGALRGTQIKSFLRTHLPSPADAQFREALALRSREPARARDLLREVIETDPDHSHAHLLLAGMAARNGERTLLEHHVRAIRATDSLYDRAQATLASIAFTETCAAAGGEEAAREAVAAAPDDLDAAYVLGCCLATAERWEEALEILLSVVQRNNRHADAAARKAMVVIFDLLGRNHVLSDRYVRQLQIYT